MTTLSTSSTFPNEIDIFMEAQDINTPYDVTNLNEYQSKIQSNDFIGASNVLANWANGYAKQLNASRYNQVIDAVKKTQNFYINESNITNYIEQEISKYAYVNQYSPTIFYSFQNIVLHNDSVGNPTWLIAKIASQGKEPFVDPLWENYWTTYLTSQTAKQYPVQITEPIGQVEGDLWWRIIQ